MARRTSRLLIVIAIAVIAIVVRDAAVRGLPIDFDEPVYFRAGQRYAAAIRDGDLGRLINDDYVSEHPGLVKLLYSAVFMRYPPTPELSNEPGMFESLPAADQMRIAEMGTAARRASALLGVANVILVSLVSLPAGVLLAVHTYTIKYTSLVYLEALPMLTATVAVFAYLRSRRQPNRWWWLSAVALGLTAAGKYVYCVAGLAIAVDLLWDRAARRDWRGLRPLAAWIVLALLTFLLFNPYLWPGPVDRLVGSLIFHTAFSQGEHVQSYAFPFYQPLVWLFTSVPWHPGIIFTSLDTVTAALGVLGLRRTWSHWDGRGRVVVLWWLIGLLFLLLWSTKWPQYSLIMTVPVCLCAGEAIRWLWDLLPSEMKTIGEVYE